MQETLFNICSYIDNYLEKNNVILYCYCSHEYILKHKKKENWSNQEYRSLLFDTMFSRSNKERCINEKIIIEDEDGNHYIHLISLSENEKYFSKISSTILSFK
jgi:hypothetical protein